MYGVFLISETGDNLVAVGAEKIKGDASLMGAFLAAVQIFVRKIAGSEVDELRFGALRLLVRRVGKNYAVTLHDAEDLEAEADNLRVVKMLSKSDSEKPDERTLEAVREMVLQTDEDSQKIHEGISEWVAKTMRAANEWADKVF